MAVPLGWLPIVAICSSCAQRERPGEIGFVNAPVSSVVAQSAGQVEAVTVREGDSVRTGQVLARLDARELRAAVMQAEAELEAAREVLRKAGQDVRAALPTRRAAGADIAHARAAQQEAQSECERTQQLFMQGAASQSQLDAADAARKGADAELNAAVAGRAEVGGRIGAVLAAEAQARAGVRSAQAVLEQQRAALEQMVITSPFDGSVVEIDLREGEWAAPGTPVVTVEDRTRQWIRLDLGETRLSGLRPGQRASIRVLALPERVLRGHVMDVGAVGEFAINRDVKRGHPDIRTFRVRVALDEPGGVRPGMTAEVRFPQRDLRSARALP